MKGLFTDNTLQELKLDDVLPSNHSAIGTAGEEIVAQQLRSYHSPRVLILVAIRIYVSTLNRVASGLERWGLDRSEFLLATSRLEVWFRKVAPSHREATVVSKVESETVKVESENPSCVRKRLAGAQCCEELRTCRVVHCSAKAQKAPHFPTHPLGRPGVAQRILALRLNAFLLASTPH